MTLSPLAPGRSLKKSPFLVIRRISEDEVRVYSKLHGNLKSFRPEIEAVFKVFDSPVKIEDAAGQIVGIYGPDPTALITELYERRFLVDEGCDAAGIFTEYVSGMKSREEIAKVSKITFLVSARCNLACHGCYHSFYDFKSQNMDVGFAQRVFDGLFPYLKKKEIAALVISYLGYEPFVNFAAIRDISDRAREMGKTYGVKVSFKIFTNAFSLSDAMFDWIAHNKDELGIKVSLDGIREDNDKRRVDRSGKGTYDRVVANLQRVMATGVDCGILVVLSRINFPNLEKFVDEMAAIGVRHITANIFCGQSDEERALELSEDEKFEAVRRMDQATEKYGIEFDGEFKFAVLQMITGAHFTCPAGLKQMVFCSDGAIHPCQRFAGTEIGFGKYTDDFWDRLLTGRCEGYNSWNNDVYNGVMMRLSEKDADLTGWSCPFVPFIRGQCLNSNIERRFHEQLLDYYVTRPIDRIIAKSRMPG